MAQLIDLDAVRHSRTPEYRRRDQATKAAKAFLEILIEDGGNVDEVRDGFAELQRTMGALGIATPT